MVMPEAQGRGDGGGPRRDGAVGEVLVVGTEVLQRGRDAFAASINVHAVLLFFRPCARGASCLEAD